jgi:hypothetical protein
MDGLKKEWRETQIPPEIRIRARNRAWEKIHRPVYRKKAGALAFAACAIALAALFVRFPNIPEPRVEPVVSGQWSVVGDQFILRVAIRFAVRRLPARALLWMPGRGCCFS